MNKAYPGEPCQTTDLQREYNHCDVANNAQQLHHIKTSSEVIIRAEEQSIR